MKISLITVCWNAEQFVSQCINSVLSQKYNDVEYIIIDGNSSDATLSIIKSFEKGIVKLVSESDEGIYDAMNKGIALATGDVIGILNADDFLADDTVLERIAEKFIESGADVVYGNLWYVDRTNLKKVIRKWISKPYTKNLFQWGWMPAHPTFYVRREIFKRYGVYNLDFKSAADYELMLRFMYKKQTKSIFIDYLLVKMRVGGVSNQSLKNRISANLNDLRAMRLNGIKWPWMTVFLKPIRKLSQFFNF
jgi:glycosyltransferase involved in cell wall biosynthesis